MNQTAFIVRVNGDPIGNIQFNQIQRRLWRVEGELLPPGNYGGFEGINLKVMLHNRLRKNYGPDAVISYNFIE